MPMTKFKIKGFEISKRESQDLYELLDDFQEKLAKYLMKIKLEGAIKGLPYWEIPPYETQNGTIYKVAIIYIRDVGYEVFVIVNQEDNLFKIKDYYLTKKPEPPVPL